MSVTLAKKSDPHPVDVPFHPVIVIAPTRVAHGVNPAAVRLAYASQLRDRDLIVGTVPFLTWASRKALASGTGTPISEGVFAHRPYTVRTPHIDGRGWVITADGRHVAASDLLLIIPARTR
uniref:hypothetical protein n=1 Tax=Streptomyces sp. CA-136453 TaxID=3240050 RepID=UPI003F49702E